MPAHQWPIWTGRFRVENACGPHTPTPLSDVPVMRHFETLCDRHAHSMHLAGVHVRALWHDHDHRAIQGPKN